MQRLNPKDIFIKYIDRGPKQGVHNGENDAGKKASKCPPRHPRTFWRRQSEQVPGIQLYWNLIKTHILYILGSYLIGPVLVMRREMTNATTVVRSRVLGKLPRKGTQRVADRIATSTWRSKCGEILILVLTLPVGVSDRMALQLH